MNPRVAWLIELQHRAFAKSPWHSVLGALKGVDENTFFHVPPHHSGFPWMNGSICDIVFHIAGDKLVQMSAAFENGTTTWDNLPLKKTSMQQMIAELHAAHARLAAKLASETDLSLTNKITSWGGKSMSAENLYLMLIEHDLYHAGQIRYARNLLEP